jgi:hypothetical protein
LAKIDENEFKAVSYAILYGKRDDAVEAVDKMIDTITSIEYKDSYFLIVNNLLDSILKSCVAIDKLYSSYLAARRHRQRGFLDAKTSDSAKASFERLIDRVIEINNGSASLGCR